MGCKLYFFGKPIKLQSFSISKNHLTVHKLKISWVHSSQQTDAHCSSMGNALTLMWLSLPLNKFLIDYTLYKMCKLEVHINLMI